MLNDSVLYGRLKMSLDVFTRLTYILGKMNKWTREWANDREFLISCNDHDIILVLGRLKQKDPSLNLSLGYILRPPWAFLSSLLLFVSFLRQFITGWPARPRDILLCHFSELGPRCAPLCPTSYVHARIQSRL